jgi:ABC-type transport system involved in multi-copper enzyme maturation permease subunit
MNAPTAILTITWLARDTLRQALASGVFWLMLTISAVCIVFCLSIQPVGGLEKTAGENVEFLPRNDPEAAKAEKNGVDIVNGELQLAFGAFPVRMGRDREDAVHHVQLILAGAVADTLGLLLALIFTAGFIPTFLEPSAVSVLLAKPVPRWSLLAGKYLGVVIFVLFHAVIFIGGTWLALGISTNIWSSEYLLCIPLLLLHFSVFYAFSAYVAVCTRSTVAAVFGSMLFWALCWGINYGRHMVVLTPELGVLSPALRGLVEVGYWAFPKPLDQSLMLFDALRASHHLPTMPVHAIVEHSSFSAEGSILSSLGSTVVILAAAAWQFVKMDY